MSTSETTVAIAQESPLDQSDIAAWVAKASDKDLQCIIAAAIRTYRERTESSDLAVFPADADVTATDVMVAATAMLRAVDLQLFELGMWQAWSGKQ